VLGPGHFFGEGCLNGHPVRIATTRAMEDCLITRLDKETMIATIHKKPEFSELFMSYLLTRNSRIEEDLIDQLFKFERKAPCSTSPPACKFRQGRQTGAYRGKVQSGNPGGDDWHDPIARELFHEQVRKLGFVTYNGRLEVHNSLLNVILYDTPEIKM
jgi:CRP/FNR family transcriptional regulator, cyclic AMP receptor protein